MGMREAEESNVTGEPLPRTSQDRSSSLDSENVEEDEACSETWTIVDRKELNRVLEKSVTCCFCKREIVYFEDLASTGLGAEWVC